MSTIDTTTEISTYSLIIFRLTADGSLDTTFNNTDPYVTYTAISLEVSQQLLVLPDAIILTTSYRLLSINPTTLSIAYESLLDNTNNDSTLPLIPIDPTSFFVAILIRVGNDYYIRLYAYDTTLTPLLTYGSYPIITNGIDKTYNTFLLLHNNFYTLSQLSNNNVFVKAFKYNGTSLNTLTLTGTNLDYSASKTAALVVSNETIPEYILATDNMIKRISLYPPITSLKLAIQYSSVILPLLS